MKAKLITLSLSLILFNMAFLQGQDKKVRNLDTFENIEIDGMFEVDLKAGKKNTLTIKTSDQDQSNIITEVVNGTLYVSPKKGQNYIKTEIEIEYKKTIKSIKYSGFTDIKSSGKIRSNELVLIGGGSGIFIGDVNLDKLTINNNGSGEVIISGKAKSVNVASCGATDIDISKMQSKEAILSTSGSSDIKCWVTDLLKASTSGTGKIKYKENPKNSKLEVGSMGEISSYQ